MEQVSASELFEENGVDDMQFLLCFLLFIAAGIFSLPGWIIIISLLLINGIDN